MDEGAKVCEFLFDPPLKRGELRGARHRITFSGGNECHEMGYSLSRPAALLLTARFEGEAPKHVVHTVRSSLGSIMGHAYPVHQQAIRRPGEQLAAVLQTAFP